jgi:hypothetical protein
MAQRPSDPRAPNPSNTHGPSPESPRTQSNGEARSPSGLPQAPNAIAETARAAIEDTLIGWTTDSEELASMLAEALERLREERKLLQDDLAAVTRSQQSLNAAAQRLDPLASRALQDLTTGIEAAGTAMAKARGQLWDEADTFRRSVRREIRWLIRAPLIAVVLLSIVCGLLWNALQAERRLKADLSVDKPILRLEKPRR